jgi:hypothetical protein
MVKTLLSIFLCFTLVFSANIVYGQYISRDVVGASSGIYTTPNLSISFVIGEPVADLLIGSGGANLFFTAGFIQPDLEVQLIAANISQSIVVYPNPAAGSIVKVGFNHVPDGIYTIDVIDANGRILQTQTVNYFQNNFFYVPLNVSQLKGGIYFIKVINSLSFQGEVKLIKI